MQKVDTPADERMALRVLQSVDDTPLFRSALEVLGRAYEVEHRRVDSPQALRDCIAAGEWDLLLCDPVREHAGCRDILVELRETGSDLLVVALSDAGDEELITELLGAGIDTALDRAHLARLLPIVERRLEDVRVRRHRELQVLIQSSPDPMLVVGADGRILHANSLVEELLGYAEAELAGHLVEVLIPDNLRARHALNRRRYVAAPRARPMGAGIELVARHRDGREIPVEISLGPVRLAGESLVCCGIRDLRERKRTERQLRAILEGTAGQVGDEFLSALVKNLASALEVRCAFISKLPTDGEARARVLAFWRGEGYAEPFDYELPGTPCASVQATGECVVRNAIRESFPGDARLESLGAESFYGVRLSDGAGRPLGVLAIVDTKTLADERTARTVMRIFAARAGVELERIQAMESLAESEARFRSLTELSTDYYWEQDEQLRFVKRIGMSWEKNLDPHNSVIGKKRWDLPAPNLNEADWAAHRANVEAHREFRDFEIERPLPTGETRWISTSGRPFYDAEGRFLGYRGIGRDITARKVAENALRRSEEQARLIADNVPAMIVYIDRELRYGYVNRQYAEFTNLAPARFIGNTVPQMIGGKAWRELGPSLESAIEGSAVTLEMRYRRADGSLRDLVIDLVPHKDAAGAVHGVYAMLLDVTRRRRAERALRERDARLGLVVDNVPAMICYFDAEYRYHYANRRYVELFDAGESVEGRTLRDVLGEALWEEVRPRIDRALAGAPQNYSHSHTRADGSPAEVDVSLIPERDANGRTVGVHTMILDVTARTIADRKVRDLTENLERRVAERTRDLEAANRELESANRELEAFSYSVSHDLRAPLRTIAAFSAMLKEDLGNGHPPEILRHLKRVEDSALNMARLIDGLLALAHTSRATIARVDVDMGALAGAVAAELLEQADGRTVVRIGDLPPASCDPTLIGQVWQNLVGNALKFSAGAERPTVDIEAIERDGEVAYCVRDNGAGFDMRYADKLFGVFERLHTRSEFEGTGIGLATVQRIVTRHGGRVWGEGIPDRGAAFYFTLPPAG